jgi:hypothetical protein
MRLDDSIEELASVAEFCDDEEVFVVLEELVDLDDVGMVLLNTSDYQPFENFDFTQNSLELLFCGIVLEDNLDRSDLAGLSLDALPDLSEGSLTKGRPENVILFRNLVFVLKDHVGGAEVQLIDVGDDSLHLVSITALYDGIFVSMFGAFASADSHSGQ